MTAIRSIKTTRTEDMTAKPAFRDRRAIVAAAAVIACGLLAAPLQADHEAYEVTVTLTGTVNVDESEKVEQVKLEASVSSLVDNPKLEQTGFQFREWEGGGNAPDSWWDMGTGVNVSSVEQYVHLDGDGPFHFQARVWHVSAVDGDLHFSVSEPSETVTVDLSEESEE